MDSNSPQFFPPGVTIGGDNSFYLEAPIRTAFWDRLQGLLTFYWLSSNPPAK